MGVKKKSCDMGKSPFKEYLWQAQRWCIKEGIYISAEAKNDTAWWVVIKNKGKTNTSPDTFGKTVIWEKIFEYYKYYYEKHRK
jgi:hypothetical protein